MNENWLKCFKHCARFILKVFKNFLKVHELKITGLHLHSPTLFNGSIHCMRLYFTAFIFIIFTVKISAQSKLSLLPSSAIISVSPDSNDTRIKVIVKNNGNKRARINWERINTMIPNSWNSFVSDANTIWSQVINKSPKSLEIAPKGIQTIEIGVRPNGTTGTAQIEFIIKEEGNYTTAPSAKFIFQTKTATSETLGNNVRLFPNPVIDVFSVEGEQLDKIVIYNMLGRMVKTLKIQEGAHFNISDLPEGLYVARVMNNAGTPVKTIRLTKSRLKA